jgi:hypothetical protein
MHFIGLKQCCVTMERGLVGIFGSSLIAEPSTVNSVADLGKTSEQHC